MAQGRQLRASTGEIPISDPRAPYNWHTRLALWWLRELQDHRGVDLDDPEVIDILQLDKAHGFDWGRALRLGRILARNPVIEVEA